MQITDRAGDGWEGGPIIQNTGRAFPVFLADPVTNDLDGEGPEPPAPVGDAVTRTGPLSGLVRCR
jgi:hypothetical protein